MRLPSLVLLLGVCTGSCNKTGRKEVTATATPCVELSVLPAPIPERLHAVFFINGRKGFVAGEQGGIYKTSDSAKSWTPLHPGIALPVRSLFFLDAQTGFAAGGQNACSGSGCEPPGGFILRTTDGGQTWENVYTPAQKIEITSIYFVTALKGFCAGNDVILKTSDGGQSWSEYKVPGLHGNMMQIRFAGPQKGYIACLSDKVILTEDGGTTWQVTSPQRNAGYYAVSEANGSTYLSGQGKILKSTDGGASWVDLANAPADIYDLHFRDAEKGFAFGRGNYSGGDFGRNYGSVYCTEDGGSTWTGTAEITETGLIQAVHFPADDIGYAISGPKVVRIRRK
ncbi:MAG TPA: YCF48-related protein [Chitinophagaceae bacterium]|jgi:photosystem II stability/assembly factor-like uncharacterized protein|nr:YCF48-related protein [Chitinophagaceae bacterium]